MDHQFLRYNFTFFFLPLGISDWDTPEESDIIARVLAQSQQEYLDSLKRNAKNSKENSDNQQQQQNQHNSPGSSKWDCN